MSIKENQIDSDDHYTRYVLRFERMDMRLVAYFFDRALPIFLTLVLIKSAFDRGISFSWLSVGMILVATALLAWSFMAAFRYKIRAAILEKRVEETLDQERSKVLRDAKTILAKEKQEGDRSQS